MKGRSKTTGQTDSSAGVEAEAEARDDLNTNYRSFMSETDRSRKDEAGKDLIRSIFGKNAIAEDSLL